MTDYDPTQDLDYNDIYACDKCGGPTFHDAPGWAARQNAYIGELKVLCNRCACTHKLVIQPKGGTWSQDPTEATWTPSRPILPYNDEKWMWNEGGMC